MADRLKRRGLAGGTITLKLKTDRFRIVSRRQSLAAPTQLADVIFRTAAPLLAREATGTAFRLIGVGVSGIADQASADPPDLLSPDRQKAAQVERAIDSLRAKLGHDVIVKGRGFKST